MPPKNHPGGENNNACEQSRSLYFKLWLLVCFLIGYGSFFPFHIKFNLNHDIKLLQGLFSLDIRSGFSDILSNIALFIPFGFMGAKAITSPRFSFLSVTVYGFFFAFILQFFQIFIPSRVPSLTDALWNTAGCILGVFMVCIIRTDKFFTPRNRSEYFSVPVLIVLCWLVSQLFPFVPSLDFGEIKHSLKPLLIYHEFSWISCLNNFVSWIIVGFLIFSVFPKGFSKFKFFILIALVLSIKVVIVTRTLSLSSVIGAFSAFMIWNFIPKHGLQVNKVLVVLIMGAVLINGVFPLNFRFRPQHFNIIPFYGFLTGSMLHNLIVLPEKMFIYGSMVYLLRQITGNHVLSVLISCFWVFSVELLQVWSAVHTPEITDPLMVLIIAVLINIMGKNQKYAKSL
jgi:glycopeptide antibiotics resistance protein